MNRNRIASIFLSTLAALSAVSPVLTPALAETPGRLATSVSVNRGDLDLASDAGIATLDRRLALAVRHACGSADARELQAMADVRRCRREALASANAGRTLALTGNASRPALAVAPRMAPATK
jgi:UrcA family protein